MVKMQSIEPNIVDLVNGWLKSYGLDYKNITRSNLKDILGVSKSTIERDILKLKEEDKLEYIGSSKNGYWKVKNN